MSNEDIDEILDEYNQGIKLDIGCGKSKHDGFVGLDKRDFENVEIVHDLERFPYPLPDESVSFAVASHVLEHISPSSPDPRLVGLINLLRDKDAISDGEIEEYIGEYQFDSTFIRFMDELWRILQEDGKFAFVCPYADSHGWWQDPTHRMGINEVTLAYFDPLDESSMWGFYEPKPWKILESSFTDGGHIEVMLQKRRIDESYEPEEGPGSDEDDLPNKLHRHIN